MLLMLIRLFAIAAAFLFWERLIRLLNRIGFVHSLRIESAVRFRLPFVGLCVIVELFVVGTIPNLVVNLVV